MKILTINCGSSSVKYSLWDMGVRERVCEGIAERVTLDGSFIKHKVKGKTEEVVKKDFPKHDTAIAMIISLLTDRKLGVIDDVSEIGAVGHRVVHGGRHFTRSVKIDESVIRVIEQCSRLAPLHNPPNLLGIKIAMEAMPNIPHFAVFDTAFLSTLPPHAYTYGIPYEWYEKFDVRKYGFHGTSHLYVSRRAAALLGRKPSEVNVITVHIGNGVSITAVKKGAAYDHSMGFTPLEGAVMGTRCGDIDPAIPLVMMRQLNVNADDMEKILNTKSGLLGITGKYVDRRDIRKAAKEGDERSRLAIDVECYRLRKYIGAYVAAMNGTDCIVFTAGVGENSPLYREKICENLNSLGIAIDKEKNEQAVGAGEREIGSRESRVKIFVIPTNEELVFAEDAVALLQNRYDIHTQFEYEFQKIGYRP